MIENVKQLERLQKAKASFDVTKWDKAEKNRQRMLMNMKQYPEHIINEIPRGKPPMGGGSKRSMAAQQRRQQSVDPSRHSPRNRLPDLPPKSRGQTPGTRAFRSVLPPSRVAGAVPHSSQMQAGLYPSAQNMHGSKPSTGGRFHSRARSRPNQMNQSMQQVMRGTHFVPSNVYGSVSSVNDTPP